MTLGYVLKWNIHTCTYCWLFESFGPALFWFRWEIWLFLCCIHCLITLPEIDLLTAECFSQANEPSSSEQAEHGLDLAVSVVMINCILNHHVWYLEDKLTVIYHTELIFVVVVYITV